MEAGGERLPGPGLGAAPPAHHGAPNPAQAAREDPPARCQPSSAPRWDPWQRLWAGGAGGAGWAGTCQGRPGAAAAGAGGGERHPSTYGHRHSTWHLGPGTVPDGSSEWAVLSPQPLTGCSECSALSPTPNRCKEHSAPAPPLPTWPCTTCFSSGSSSSVEGKPSVTLPSPGLAAGGPLSSPPAEGQEARRAGWGSLGGVPRFQTLATTHRALGQPDPALPDYQPGQRDETLHRDGDQSSPPNHPASHGVSPGLGTD